MVYEIGCTPLTAMMFIMTPTANGMVFGIGFTMFYHALPHKEFT
jgi:hypothetical protein